MRTLTKDIVGKVGETVELCGWVAVRRDHGKLIFIDLRDRSGIVQLVITSSDKTLYERANTLRTEWVVKIIGKVNTRPEKMVNKEIPTAIAAGDFTIKKSS